MCRNIKTLRNRDHQPSDEEIQAAALQFVRKAGGSRLPPRANHPAFDQAVAEVSAATRLLFKQLSQAKPARAGS